MNPSEAKAAGIGIVPWTTKKDMKEREVQFRGYSFLNNFEMRHGKEKRLSVAFEREERK